MAVLGIALVATGEDIGAEMTCVLLIIRFIMVSPLCVVLFRLLFHCSVSYPDYGIVDQMSRLTAV